MNQLSFDELFDDDKELIHCKLSEGYHWLRITEGHTPAEFADRIHFSIHNYDYLYEETKMKDEIISRFTGPMKTFSLEEGISYGKDYVLED